MPVALIAGAMVPDLPYYLDIPVTAESWYEPLVNATFSHSFQGLVLVGLPSVILLGLLFQLIRRPISDLLPLQLGFKDSEEAPKRKWFIFCAWFLISALIGITTHYVWDSLTEVSHAANRVLQHGSTAVGAIIIVVWCIRRFLTRDVTIARVAVSRGWIMQRVAIILAIFLVSVGFAAYSVAQVQNLEGPLGVEHTLTLLLKSGLRTFAVAVVLYALIWYAVHLSKQRLSQNANVQGSDSRQV